MKYPDHQTEQTGRGVVSVLHRRERLGKRVGFAERLKTTGLTGESMTTAVTYRRA
jgi:hypothetical protein